MLNISLRRFEVFLAVVARGSFAGAADQLDISQPSVSTHIHALERQVGGPVFERRRGRRPVLTELGNSVLVHAREMVAEADDLHSHVLSIQSSKGNQVIFACQRSVANFILKRQITQFALRHPHIHLVLRIGTQEEVIDQIREGRADVGCYLSNEQPRGLDSDVIGHEPLVLVSGPDHPLARRTRIAAADIEKFGFVGAAAASMFGRAVSRQLKLAGVRQISLVAQVTEYQFLRELVGAGVGLSCSPASSVRDDIERGVLKVLDFKSHALSLDIRLLTSHRREASVAARTLTDFLRSHSESISGVRSESRL